MPDKTIDQEVLITILASGGLFVFLSIIIVRFLFLYQHKRKRYKEDLADMEKKYQKEILASRLEVQEQTRIYIGQELHDNIGALASLIKINLNLAELTDEPVKKQEWISESKEITKKLITEVKELSLDLNLDRLGNIGFVKLLQQDIQRIQKLGIFNLSFLVEGEEWNLSSDRQIILYRICQELLHNIIKHANAGSVMIKLTYSADSLLINMIDDGIGFDTESVFRQGKETNGSGLVNMQKRIQMIGGSLDMERMPDKGIQSFLKVPIQKSQP